MASRKHFIDALFCFIFTHRPIISLWVGLALGYMMFVNSMCFLIKPKWAFRKHLTGTLFCFIFTLSPTYSMFYWFKLALGLRCSSVSFIFLPNQTKCDARVFRKHPIDAFLCVISQHSPTLVFLWVGLALGYMIFVGFMCFASTLLTPCLIFRKRPRADALFFCVTRPPTCVGAIRRRHGGCIGRVLGENQKTPHRVDGRGGGVLSLVLLRHRRNPSYLTSLALRRAFSRARGSR